MRRCFAVISLSCLTLGLGTGSAAARAAHHPAGAGIAAAPHTRCCVRIDVSVFGAGTVRELPGSSHTGAYNSVLQWEEQLIGQYQWSSGSSFIELFHPGWAEASINEGDGIVSNDGTRDHWCTDLYGNRVYSHDWSKAETWDPSDFGIPINRKEVGPIVAPFTGFLWCHEEEPVFPDPSAEDRFGAGGWESLWPGMSGHHIAAFKAGRANFALHCEYRTYVAYPGEVRKSFVSAGITLTSFPEDRLKSRLKATRKMTARDFPHSGPLSISGSDLGGLSGPNGTAPGPWPDGSAPTKPTCTHA
jgi:hypothetical protein